MAEEVSSLIGYGLVFVVLAVVLAVGAYILSSIGNTAGFASGSVPANTLNEGQQALQTFSNWLPILAVVIVAAIIIYLLLRMFAGGHGGEGR